MKKQNAATWFLLILLTVLAGWISGLNSSYTFLLILVLSVLKFMGVSFVFMEMKKAHPFWKGLIIGFMVIFLGLIVLIMD